MKVHAMTYIPQHQLGYILPIPVADGIHYQFYQISPRTMSIVGCPLHLRTLSADGAKDALAPFWDAFDFLVAREVDRITLGGIPLSAFSGRTNILSMLNEAKQKTPIPVTTDFEESIDAIRHLGLTNIAVAAKWSPELLGRVGSYLDHAGIASAGVHGSEHTAQQVMALRPKESVDIALALGRSAFQQMPDADGLLLAGGAWFVLEAIPILEAEFRKPVITNPTASCWAALRQFGCRPRSAGHGRLIDSLL